MTFLQLINSVLGRLREDDVALINSTDYAVLIGKFINDTKRQVEDAWRWDALYNSLTVTTASGTSTYSVTGSGLRSPQSVVINDTTNDVTLRNVSRQWIIDQQQNTDVTNAQPCYYAWAGNDTTDNKIILWPTPDGTYTLKVNGYFPQADLDDAADVLLVPPEAVIAGAYARAVVERGEDGGMSSSEAYGLYKGILSDQIALEASRQDENSEWVAV